MNRVKQVLLRGPPGCGKSSFAKYFVNQIPQATYISSGEILRRHFESSEMNKGELADSELVLKLMKDKFDTIKSGIVLLDGFPRKVCEFKEWIRLTSPPDVIVRLMCDEELIVKKLINRYICNTCGAVYNSFTDKNLKPMVPKTPGVCDHCQGGNLVQRSDDCETSIRRRLEIFRDTEADVLKFAQSDQGNYRFVSCDNVRDVGRNEKCLRTILDLIPV